MPTPLSHALPPSSVDPGRSAPGRGKPRRRRRALIPALISIAALTALVGSGFAASVTINSGNAIEFGQGKNNVSACDSSATASLASSYDASDSRVEVSGLTITSLASTCEGKYLRASLLDSSGTVLDSAEWYFSKGSLTCASGFTASANGTTTASSNAASSGVCTAYPNKSGSTITVSGASIPSISNSDLNVALTGGSSGGEAAADVNDLLIETSDTAFTATD